MSYQFEWDIDKAIKNSIKHGVSFEEAATVFDDEFSITIEDPDHSITELRDITIGLSLKNRLLLVFSTERNNKIRIFSAREATKKERINYEETR
jgi:hypothetical protein